MIAGFELLDRQTPPTLDVGRRTGIAEVETGYGDAEAAAQAARCLVCHVQTVYDPEACVLCGRCVDVCPEHFTRRESLETPMASHLVAHASAPSRDADPVAAGGTPVSAAELFGPGGPPDGDR